MLLLPKISGSNISTFLKDTATNIILDLQNPTTIGVDWSLGAIDNIRGLSFVLDQNVTVNIC